MATIQDVAKRAQVSKSTVSYAFNKPHLVKPETHARILQAARELNYEPNVFAQGLAGGRVRMIGLLVADLRYPFTANIARGVEDVLRNAGYITAIASTDGDAQKTVALMEQLRARGIGGFVLVPSYFAIGQELLQAVQMLQIGRVPVVVAGFEINEDGIDRVAYQPQKATKEAVDYLISLGHRRIAYLGYRHMEMGSVARYLGYQESLHAHQIPLRPELVVETDITPEKIKVGMQRLMLLAEPPTAIFALNDVVASAVLDFCYENYISIPEELSLVSFDYKGLVQRSRPAMTAVVIPVYDVGARAAELLLDRFQNPDLPAQHIDIEYRFKVRDTTAPAVDSS